MKSLITTTPVDPPLPWFAPEGGVTPSIWRSNVPVSVVGSVTLLTTKVGLRVLMIVQTLFSPAASVIVPSAAQAPPICDT